jgi:hypothetical protein
MTERDLIKVYTHRLEILMDGNGEPSTRAGLARGCIRDIEAAGLQARLADVYRGFIVIEAVSMALIAAAAKLHAQRPAPYIPRRSPWVPPREPNITPQRTDSFVPPPRPAFRRRS